MPHESNKKSYAAKPGHPGSTGKPTVLPGRRVGRNPTPGTPRKVGPEVKLGIPPMPKFGRMPKPKAK